jgi:UDP-2,4-diacetamido-2,4,6-trideoxy-beta-L-altropyranose hydrolase
LTLRIREAEAEDAEFLWQWRNDPLVRQNSFNSDPIPWAQHQSWYVNKLNSPGTLIYILDEDGEPVGQIRYERVSHELVQIASISVRAEKRGRGYGKMILCRTVRLACEKLDVAKVVAVVKENNIASLHTFKAAGFDVQDEYIEQDSHCKRLLYSRPGASSPA